MIFFFYVLSGSRGQLRLRLRDGLLEIVREESSDMRFEWLTVFLWNYFIETGYKNEDCWDI